MGRVMDEGDDLQSWRRAQREALVARRLALPEAERSAAIAAIRRQLEGHFSLLGALVVGFCWPWRGEVDVRPLLRGWRERGARCVLPEVVARAAPLAFRTWWPGAPMRRGVFDLPVPDGTALLAPQALLVPLVGFDDAGYRLGWGGGYFDRTLAALQPRPLAIGVGFELSRLPTIRPQPHDVAMDFIVTEAGTRRVADDGLLPLEDGWHTLREATALLRARGTIDAATADAMLNAVLQGNAGPYASPVCYASEFEPADGSDPGHARDLGRGAA